MRRERGMVGILTSRVGKYTSLPVNFLQVIHQEVYKGTSSRGKFMSFDQREAIIKSSFPRDWATNTDY